METKTFKIDKNDINRDLLREAADLLKEGGIVAFPTETVYGLGGSVFSPEAVAKIFEAKGRPADNPLIAHIYSLDQLEDLAEKIPLEARLLAEKFWPGPLTMVLKAKEGIPKIVTAGLDSIGIRMPADPVALAFLEEVDLPLAAPSANLSGRPSPTIGQHVLEDLAGKIEGILLSDQSLIGIESTVIDLTKKPALILRPGAISLEEIALYINVKYQEYDERERPLSPGNKYRHYAPKAKLFLVAGDQAEKKEKFSALIEEVNSGKKPRLGLFLSDQLFANLSEDRELLDHPLLSVKKAGSLTRPSEIIANLYKNLREYDQEELEEIYMEDIEEEIAGSAFRNRIEKASEGRRL